MTQHFSAVRRREHGRNSQDSFDNAINQGYVHMLANNLHEQL